MPFGREMNRRHDCYQSDSAVTSPPIDGAKPALQLNQTGGVANRPAQSPPLANNKGAQQRLYCLRA
jgi:hypothetical protein